MAVSSSTMLLGVELSLLVQFLQQSGMWIFNDEMAILNGGVDYFS
jgi:hypothetical protein